MAKLALYVSPGYPGPKGPHRIAVAFALWDDGTLRRLSSLDPDLDRSGYQEATLSSEQRLELIRRLERILGDLPRPATLDLDPGMHSSSAHLVVLAGDRGIALSRRFTMTETIGQLFVPQPDEDAAAFVRLWTALAAEIETASEHAAGKNVAWTAPDLSFVTRTVSR